MLRTNPKLTTLDGGSLGSWVEEDRGETRELMVIAKFSRDSIDMSNAHCGDCLAGATESLYECARRYGVAPLLTRGLCPLAETHPPKKKVNTVLVPTDIQSCVPV